MEVGNERTKALFPIYEAPDSESAVLKEQYQQIALKLLRMQDRMQTPYAKRSLAESLTLLETSSMFAVKSIHQG